MDPTNVAGYQVVERIGRGGMGVVYRARDAVLDRDVALKYIDSATGPDGHVEQLIREAKVASSLQHPSIVTIYGFVAEGPCIAMEYIRGSTLSERLALGPMAVDEVVRLGIELAEALHYAHQSGVVHADLKPANIMIDRAGRAKVLDFGLAHWRLAEELQTLSQDGENLQRLAGTIPYMSPELVMGRPLSCGSDVFSFGCVLFEMLTGRRPFAAENPAATLNALLNSAPSGMEVLRQKVPAVLVELILQMLEKDPGRRLPSLEEAVLVLWRFRDGVEAQRTVSGPRYLRLPRAPHWLPLVFTLALGLLLYFFSEPGVSSRQLRVFLAQPEYYRKGAATPLDAVIWSSVINGLHLLGSVQPVLYHRPPVEESNPAQLAKLAGSDEWIHISLQPENPLGNVQLQRIRTKDGALLQQTQFAVPKEYAEQSAQAVLSQMLALYNDVEPSESTGYASLPKEAYQRFVEIYSSLNQGVGNRQVLFKNLRTLVIETPGFLAAEILVVDLAHDLFSDTGDSIYLDHASNLLVRLRLYHPNPTVVLQREITLAIDRGEIGRAEKLLDRLTEFSPGDPAVLMTLSRLAEQRGDLAGATRLVLEAATVSPLPWKVRYRATTLAIRSGDVEAARTHITEVLKLTPDNTFVQGQSGLVELLYGDVDRAIGIYKQLLERKQHRSYMVNLGLALMLKENFLDARKEFARALDLQPEHRVAMLNLADAEMALGNRERAIDLYRNILELQQKRSGSEGVSDKMIEAQCLAHLGQYSSAIEHTLGALAEASGDPEIAYQAALVYALAGEYESALVNARVALQGGMDGRWFKLPIFSDTPVALLSENSGIR